MLILLSPDKQCSLCFVDHNATEIFAISTKISLTLRCTVADLVTYFHYFVVPKI